jgi:hypothetical protein
VSGFRNREAIMVVEGTKLEIEARESFLCVTTDTPYNLSAGRHEQTVICETSGPIQYDTYGGTDHGREIAGVADNRTGNLWPTGKWR